MAIPTQLHIDQPALEVGPATDSLTSPLEPRPANSGALSCVEIEKADRLGMIASQAEQGWGARTCSPGPRDEPQIPGLFFNPADKSEESSAMSQGAIRSRARALGFVLPATPKLLKTEYRPRCVAIRRGRHSRCEQSGS